MKLTPVEKERLWVFLAAELARKRRAAGLKLNHPEAVALITDEVIEAARAGASFDEARQLGYSVLSEGDVLDGVADLIGRLQIEGLFEDGTPARDAVLSVEEQRRTALVIPGEIVPARETVEGNAGRETVELEVTNTLDRAVQVTSHYHFFEVNRALRFPREQALGMRLDVPAGMAVRFEPGETRKVRLCAYGGRRIVRGFNGLVDGDVSEADVRAAALAKAREQGFAG